MSPVRRALQHCLAHPAHVALAVAFAYIAGGPVGRALGAVLRSSLFNNIWWWTWSLRQSIQHMLMCHVSYYCAHKLIAIAHKLIAILTDLCSLCRRQSSGARLRSALVRDGERSVLWQDHSVWVRDNSYGSNDASHCIQRDNAGDTWVRVMAPDRAAQHIFSFADTPPQSRKPTPQTDLERPHAD